ncbi:MAG: hypothetical protein FJ095_03990 [Deltaproteobacteria bacterium]|nr:hypothetical protein [Deltaproteobacteria bacterium]
MTHVADATTRIVGRTKGDRGALGWILAGLLVAAILGIAVATGGRSSKRAEENAAVAHASPIPGEAAGEDPVAAPTGSEGSTPASATATPSNEHEPTRNAPSAVASPLPPPRAPSSTDTASRPTGTPPPRPAPAAFDPKTFRPNRL